LAFRPSTVSSRRLKSTEFAFWPSGAACALSTQRRRRFSAWGCSLKRHGYRISPGALYPLLHRLTQRCYLRVRELKLGRTRRRLYRATQKGTRALAVVRYYVQELVGELDEAPIRRRSLRLRPKRVLARRSRKP
jgi:hypothetical protein